IAVHDLTVRYPRARADALARVTFSLRAGEVVLLLGPSGSGKSTIGLCLAGLIPQSVPARMAGTVLLDGQDAAALGVGERTARVGIVFQDPEAQFCMLTVEDEVAFGLENMAMPPDEMEPRIEEALRAVGLEQRRRERVDRLSGGQKQRLALACALARRPEVLFLDEPTANLDPAARQELLRVLADLRRERPELCILIVEHVLDDLIDLVDRLLVLGPGGVLLSEGRPRAVLEQHTGALDELGIWLPQVTALAFKLRLAGLLVPELPLTVDQAAEAFAPLLRLGAPQRAVRGERPLGGESAISVRGLSARYERGPEVLHRVDLEVPSGSFSALVGPNGAGKSTLASHLVGILMPPPATVRLFGDDLTALSARELTTRVGYAFQNPEHQFVEQRVADELAYSLRLRGRPEAEVGQVVDGLLASFGLGDCRDCNPFALSQGQKRRLSVATMLAVGQRALVLDEPTFGQDRHTAHALMGRLLGLQRAGVTLLTITHDMQMVADYAAHVHVLVDGRLVFAGATADLFMRPELLEQAALRPPPLHALARRAGVAYADGSVPLSLRDWYPFFGLDQSADRAGVGGAACGGC
ncbi:MAG: energy-coupling factor ABC transporter ATP-binding protein, partial [Chloroflexi bacterium]|nr:energy-coupling factor ABC transporter ATP-binding protein [Chloroflexota bacterium]